MASALPTPRDTSVGPPDNATTAESLLWTYAVVVLVLDVALTAIGLERGYVEANPLARVAMETIGPLTAMLALKAFAVAVAVFGRRLLPSTYRFVAPVSLALPWTAAVGVNAAVLA
jgi:hypothetical protein